MSAHRLLFDAYAAPFAKTDPGDAGSLTVDRDRAVFPVVTTGVETRTLVQPTKAGLVATVVLKTDGGNMTLTVTGGYNNDADTAIVFGDAGDFVTFISIDSGGSYYWRVLAQEGTDAAGETLDVDALSLGGTAVTATAAEINQLDGNLLTDMTPGTGISTGTGTICEHTVYKIGGLYKTEILIDLTGLNSGGTANDIIGKDGETANCHIGQITAAVNGTIVAGRVTCFETPNGGDPDIDIYHADGATGAQDANIDTADSGSAVQLINHGDWTAEDLDYLTTMPAADEYLYLACGTATDADYDAGILLIELWGTA
jgi:hypothetical protein